MGTGRSHRYVGERLPKTFRNFPNHIVNPPVLLLLLLLSTTDSYFVIEVSMKRRYLFQLLTTYRKKDIHMYRTQTDAIEIKSPIQKKDRPFVPVVTELVP